MMMVGRKMSQRNADYWRRRAAKRMLERLEDAEVVADDLARAYATACRDITARVRKIFNTFQLNSGLSESEALDLLNHYPMADVRALLRTAVDQMQPGPEKQQALAQLNAPAYQYRIGRLEALQVDIDRRMRSLAQIEMTQTTAHYRATLTEGYYRQIFDLQQQTGLGFSFSRISGQRVAETLAQNWSGVHYSERIWHNADALSKRIKNDLMVSAMSGQGNRDIAKRLQQTFGVGAYDARRLVRTETAYMAGQAEIQSYQECGIEQYRFLATLDLKTSDKCQALDGKMFPVGAAQPGVNYPPMHPQCRSTTIITMNPEVLEGLKRRARDPATGKSVLVPANMTYREWAKEHKISTRPAGRRKSK